METPSGSDVVTPAEHGARLVAGRYRLVDRIGSGGMGTVWRAQDDVLGRLVAVKEVVFPHGLSEDEREVLRERTRREARAAARLDHPSAVTVYDVVEEDGVPFLVMEYVEARTLAEIVKHEGPLPPDQAASMGLAVLGALEAAHAQGIVHRDVKPGNVLLRSGPHGRSRVVLTDFGIATSTGDSSITSTGLLLGSPSYIAPERARGRKPGPPSDLWALGATLFTAVEGRPPYDAGDPLATVTAVVTGDHSPFVQAGPLAPVIEGLLEKDPEQRLDAATARRMLTDVVRDAPVLDLAPPAPPSSSAPSSSARRTVAPPDDQPRAAAPRGAGSRPQRTAALPVREVRERVRAQQQPQRQSVLIPVLLALVLIAGGVLGAVALLTDVGGNGGRDVVADQAPSGSAAEDDPTQQEAPRPEDVPADWTQFRAPSEGWSLFHPASYEVSERRDLTQFRDDETRYTLRVGAEPATSAVAEAQQTSATFASALGGYQELDVAPRQFRGWDAADLEFTYTDSGVTLHALRRTIVVDGTAYTLWWQTAADNFAESRDDFEALANAFVPPAP